ncbi:MAG: hypothetical protein ACK58L_05450 [Planctomycetota bacterium]
MGDESSKRNTIGGIIRGTRRASVGGSAILIGVVLYLILRGLGLPGGGPGTGGGSGGNPETTDDSVTSLSTESTDDSTVAMSPSSNAEDGLTEDEKKSVSLETLTILIDGHDYLLGIPSSSELIYRPTELKRIVELALKVKGDSSGIRVRVLRRETSRASAEVGLMTELNHVGIKQDAIVMPKEFLPVQTDTAAPN